MDEPVPHMLQLRVFNFVEIGSVKIRIVGSPNGVVDACGNPELEVHMIRGSIHRASIG